jgi:hypothetical protein
MKRFILLIIFFLPFFLSAQKIKKEDIINWSNDRPLTWADFKGKIDPANKLEAAATCTQLIVTPDNQCKDSIKYFVYAQAVKTKSWKLKKEDSDYMLKHEQTHFDIAELFARKLRKELAETAFTTKTLNSQIEKLFNKYFKLLEEEQKKYDKETNHSIIKEKQEEWNNKIKEDLNSYGSYSNPLVILKAK